MVNAYSITGLSLMLPLPLPLPLPLLSLLVVAVVAAIEEGAAAADSAAGTAEAEDVSLTKLFGGSVVSERFSAAAADVVVVVKVVDFVEAFDGSNSVLALVAASSTLFSSAIKVFGLVFGTKSTRVSRPLPPSHSPYTKETGTPFPPPPFTKTTPEAAVVLSTALGVSALARAEDDTGSADTSTRSSSQAAPSPLLSCQILSAVSTPRSTHSTVKTSACLRSNLLRCVLLCFKATSPLSPCVPVIMQVTLASVPAPLAAPVCTVMVYRTSARVCTVSTATSLAMCEFSGAPLSTKTSRAPVPAPPTSPAAPAAAKSPPTMAKPDATGSSRILGALPLPNHLPQGNS